MKTKLIIFTTTILLQFVICSIISAQAVLISSAGGAPDASAGLEVKFDNKGMLMPHFALTSTNNPSPIASPADYMMVFNTATVTDVVPGFYYWKTNKWIPITGAATSAGDMRYWDGTKWTNIPVGSAGQVLKLTTSSLVPTWTTPPQVLTDMDNNAYSTVTIGTQTWMAENLKSTKFNDGTNISNVTDNNDWANLSTGTTSGYCDYNNNASNTGVYGHLYNFVAVASGNLCPTGWHIPDSTEWRILGAYLGDNHSDPNPNNWSGTSAYVLKEEGTSHWTTNAHGTNTTGFTAVPGGGRWGDGTFGDFADQPSPAAYFWSSTYDINSMKFWYYHLDKEDVSNNFLHEDNDANPFNGLSVRCLKN